MQITAESELMKAQVHADVMAPDRAFEVLQTTDGDSLYFSIGSDNVFYVTREVIAAKTGWNKVDLSSSLSLQFNHASVAAKAFALTQNSQTLSFDVALVVTVNKADYLFLSLGNANTSAAWNTQLTYTAVPFDAAGITAPNPLTIADVYLMNIPSASGGSSTENCFVDVLRDPSDPLQLLDRYYIQPNSTPHWQRHNLALDLKAGSISSCLGKRPTDYVPGIYTFGSISNTQELVFAQQSNPFRPGAAPATARLTVPSGASAICSALNSAGATNLFVAATGGLYLFAPTNQTDLATPSLIVPAVQYNNSNIFAGVSSLTALTLGLKTTVFALNAQGDLFQVSCLAGSESTPSAWSVPFPLLAGVENFAFYVNQRASNNVVFAHTSGANLVQLTQDPITSLWSQRNILLPTTAVDDMVEFDSYTSHVTLTDDFGNMLSNHAATVTATSPIAVYVNGVYHVISPTVPININTDAAGKINIIQPTDSLDGVYMDVTVAGNPSVTVGIDPTSTAISKLSSIQSGSDLDNVKITTADGNTQSLVPSSVSSTDKDAAAKCIVQMLGIKNTLPTNGSVTGTSGQTAGAALKTVNGVKATAAKTAPASASQSFGMRTVNGSLTYIDGSVANQHVEALAGQKAIQVKAASSVASVGSDIEVLAGDFWNWMKKAWNDVTSFVVQKFEDGWHFIATIAGEVYEAIMDCIGAVISGIEFVFNKIKVGFEELIAWLGYLFQWDDILRTHKVLKNVVVQYGAHLVDQLETWKTEFNGCITQMKGKINEWANLPDDGTNIGATQKANQSAPGGNSPQANWGIQHTQKNLDAASAPTPDAESPPDLLTALANALNNEEDAVMTASNLIKTQVFDSLSSLTLVEALKKLLAICGDFVLNSAETIVDLVLDVGAVVLKGIFQVLDQTIDIPIITPFYKLITNGSDLSLLDLVCLISAIPVTIMYKIAKDEAPFPDDSTTSALINASSWDALINVINPPQARLQALQRSNRNAGAANGRLAKSSIVGESGASEVHAPAATEARVELSSTDVSSDIAAKINLAFDLASLPGSILVTICFFMKQGGGSGKPLAIVSFVSYLFYVLPDFEGTYYNSSAGYNIFNEIVTGLAIIKTGFDNWASCLNPTGFFQWNKIWLDLPSAVLEGIINFIWLGPDFWSYAEADKTAISSTLLCLANTMFDISGMLSPLTLKTWDVKWFGPEVGPIVYAGSLVATAGCNVGYGVLNSIGGVAQIDGH